MEKIIDAHVHINPEKMVNVEDPRFGARKGLFGKLTFNNGSSFQFMPCYMHDSQFTAETLIHMMDYYGISKAVILQSLSFVITKEISEAVQKYPDRLAGAMIVEPKENCLETLEQWYSRGLRVMKFEMSDGLGFTTKSAYPNMKFNDPVMSNIFSLAEKKNMTVTIDTGPIGKAGYQIEEIRQAANQHPELKFVICHLGFPRPLTTPEQFQQWNDMITLGKNENVWIDLAAMPDFFDTEGYPFHTATELLRKAVDICSSEKMLWGSDIPGTLSRATYPQMISMYENCNFLNDNDKEKIFYSNADVVYFT